MGSYLKDPFSAHYQFSPGSSQCWLKGGPLNPTAGTIYGWRVNVMVNAKNSYGAYTGWQQWAFIIRDGRVVAWNERADLGLNTWRTVP